ncbi:Addiction module toxin, RelE/StbE [Magnetospirillum sp. XM-1]|uniref:type II toxin-antitoxin system RelE/ParE family toxin n=1 Tax=Magnetospirillum sp. XM-1 TaxID=1663591 RepID=UPI00073DC425|nr:type II toxin-antitoxin system RelE/ParE family toxin [Magnetospirillum sp. XM-1]CUW40572.1 Addiction module toxin, RelE/StbE [Magnetospirillum sp. XM-1]
MRLRWTRPALRDLSDIHAYIAERDTAAALRVIRLLRAQADGLAVHSHMGREGLVEGARELVVPGLPFLIAYRVTEEFVDILALRHGARLWPGRLPAT